MPSFRRTPTTMPGAAAGVYEPTTEGLPPLSSAQDQFFDGLLKRLDRSVIARSADVAHRASKALAHTASSIRQVLSRTDPPRAYEPEARAPIYRDKSSSPRRGQ